MVSVSKWIDLMALRVGTTDPASPQRVDTSSREYAKVLSRAQSAVSAIKAVANTAL